MQIIWQHSSIQIIEVQPVNTTATVRRKNATKEALKLQTTFSYGLNDKIGEGQQRDSDTPIGIRFSSLKKNKKYPIRSRN